jgi:hypothetical protein
MHIASGWEKPCNRGFAMVRGSQYSSHETNSVPCLEVEGTVVMITLILPLT